MLPRLSTRRFLRRAVCREATSFPACERRRLQVHGPLPSRPTQGAGVPSMTVAILEPGRMGTSIAKGLSKVSSGAPSR